MVDEGGEGYRRRETNHLPGHAVLVSIQALAARELRIWASYLLL